MSRRLLHAIERLGAHAATVSAWMFFAIGGMVTYEVVTRKVLNAPTIWADEVARFFQIWATYLAAAYVLKARQLITIEVLAGLYRGALGRITEALGLVVIAVFSVIAVVYGVLILADSIALHRATSTMLGVPKWIPESAIPIGFGLLLVQALAELARVLWPGLGGEEPRDDERAVSGADDGS